MTVPADPSTTSFSPVPAPQARLSLVPEGYAQKAMASLMQLHTELMDEKERRVELHRQLMEKEQALAELRMYVKLLEEKVEQRPPARLRTRPPPPPPPASARPKLTAVRRRPPPAAPGRPAARPPAPPPPAPHTPASDGWRAW